MIVGALLWLSDALLRAARILGQGHSLDDGCDTCGPTWGGDEQRTCEFAWCWRCGS